jgi:hypothetical protein
LAGKFGQNGGSGVVVVACCSSASTITVVDVEKITRLLKIT